MTKDKKPWYKSKAKLGAILMAVGAIGSYLSGEMDIITAGAAVAGALGVFGLRDAIR